MKKLLFLLVANLAAAQVTVNLTGPSSLQPGGSGTLNFAVSGLGTTGQPSALQFTLNPFIGITLGIPTATLPTGDSFGCGTSACLIYGTQTPLSNGILVSIPFTLSSTVTPGNLTISITNIFAADPQGLSVNGITQGTLYTLKVLSPCDLNSDGSVNISDVQLVVNSIINGTSCPISVANGGCTVNTVMFEIIAAVGGACKIP